MEPTTPAAYVYYGLGTIEKSSPATLTLPCFLGYDLDVFK
jgi:hypothetical protein